MKTIFSVIVSLSIIMLASCSSDVEEVVPAGDGTLCTITVKPVTVIDITSRASSISDGSQINSLYYAVYNAADVEAFESGTKTEVTPVTSDLIKGFKGDGTDEAITVALPKGSSYDMVFWADAFGDASGSPYTFVDKTMTVAVDYAKVQANSDMYDAFAGYKKIDVDESMALTVSLKRPFTQLNFGTDDVAAEGLSGYTSTVKLCPYQRLNLKTGDVGNKSAEEVALQSSTMPTDCTYPIDGYTYVCYAYVLAPAAAETTDITLVTNYNSDYTKSYSDVPIRSNHRINIFGSIFGSQD
jgi:hypothetical protein